MTKHGENGGNCHFKSKVFQPIIQNTIAMVQYNNNWATGVLICIWTKRRNKKQWTNDSELKIFRVYRQSQEGYFHKVMSDQFDIVYFILFVILWIIIACIVLVVKTLS